MVNRTLRRPYIGTKPSVQSGASADGSVARIDDEPEQREPDTDRRVDNDGEESIRESSRDSSSFTTVEIDPERIDEYIARGGTQSNSGRDDSDSEPRKRRKYTRRSVNGRKKAQETVEPFVLMAHTWAGTLLKTPELIMTPEEAKQLSDAYASFCEYHEVPILTPKRMSELNLIAVLFMLYGPRFVAWRARMKEERVKKAKPINVTPISHANVQ